MFTCFDTIHERDIHQMDRRTDTAPQHVPHLSSVAITIIIMISMSQWFKSNQVHEGSSLN